MAVVLLAMVVGCVRLPAKVEGIEKGSIADIAGVVVGDTLVSVSGSMKCNTTVHLQYIHAGKTIDKDVRVICQ